MRHIFKQFRRDFGVPKSLFEASDFVSMDVSQTENEVILKAVIPGLIPEDIHISVTDDALIIKAEQSDEVVEKRDMFSRVEKIFREFSRSIPLPCRILPEEVTAKYKNDVLEIVLPKCKPREPRIIKIEKK